MAKYNGLTMHRCVQCGGDHVFPEVIEEHGPDHWEVLLYCGNCEVFRQDIFHDWECQLYDEWLDDCTEAIENAAALLAYQNMNDMKKDCAKFTRALELDIIKPDDFG